MDDRELAQYRCMEEASGVTGLYREVSKAADQRGVDVPRSILSHVLRKRVDKRDAAHLRHSH